MAEIVGAVGVPHTPYYPALVEREGPGCETARLFAAVTKELEAMRPDLIVMYDTDHLNTFFLDNLPVFAIGVTGEFRGPNDEPRSVPVYTIRSRRDVAGHLRRLCIEAGFDIALAQEFTVDHSVVVPLHFICPAMRVPVIPIFIGGHVPPLPSARRCYELGATVKRAIESWPEPLRVVVIGSGSFSLEVFGPRIAPGKSDGVPEPEWARRVGALIEQGSTQTLLDEVDRRSDAACRQRGRRAARLDRHARCRRRAAAEVSHAAAGAGSRLRRLELELIPMSIYAVNYLCREVLRDHGFRAAMKADPAAALAKHDLTSDERQALLAGDVAKLYRLGANAFLMGYLPRFEVCGLTLPLYNERIRSAAGVEGERP